MGRIGKRVRIPHGPATVMLIEAADYSATGSIIGKAVGGEARK